MKRWIRSLALIVALAIALLGDWHNVLAASCGTYIVRPGDSLLAISATLDVSLQGLMTVNGLTNARAIVSGQALAIACEAPSPGRPSQKHHVGKAVEVSSNPAAPKVDPQSDPIQLGSGPKSIVVSIAKQRAYAYEGDTLVYQFVVSTALPQYGTKRGTFRVKTKMPEAYSRKWELRMPYWMGIYDAGPSENGFHALPILKSGRTLWSKTLGHPASFGCIILGTKDAATLYRWADMGTLVTIK